MSATGEIDLIAGQKAFEQVDQLILKIAEADEKMLSLANHALLVNKNTSNLSSPKALNELVTSNAKITSSIKEQVINVSDLRVAYVRLNNEHKEVLKTSKQMEQQSYKESQSRNALNKQREQSIAQSEKEAVAAEKANNAYNKVQAKINGMLPIYNNLQTKVQLGLRLSAKEEAQLKLLETRLIKYNDILKKTDINIGNHRREVGNYAKANSNLTMSIAQISRELPNFGQSFHIGVLSLTNNVGALLDGIKQVKAQNAALRAEGKPTTSVLSQITGALLSWQTALFVGIGLLSAYSDEIGDWVQQLFEGEKQLGLTTEAQLRMNKAQFDAKVQYQKESQAYKELISIITNTELPYNKRKTAIEELKSLYPGYLKNLTDEQILHLKGSQLEKELFKAVGAKAKYEANKQEINQSKEKLALVENQIAYLQVIENLNNRINKGTTVENRMVNGELQSILNMTEDAKKAQKELKELRKTEETRNKVINDETITGASKKILLTEQIKLTKQINEADKKQIPLKEKQITLDEKSKDTNKIKREKLALSFKEVESEYALQKATLERKKAEIGGVMNSDNASLDAKIQARIEYSKISIELLNLEAEKEKAVYTLKYADDLAKNNLALKNKDISYQQHADNITDINARYNNEIQRVDVETSDKWNAIVKEDANYYKNIEDEKRGFTEKTNELILKSEQNKFKKIADDETKTLAVRQKAFQEYLVIERKLLDIQKIRELANSKSDEETASILEKYKSLNADLDQIESPFVKARKDFEKYIQSLSMGQLEKALSSIGLSSAKLFLDFDKNGETTFSKLFEQAENFKEQFAIAFQTIGDVAQDTFNFIKQVSNDNFENEYANLEKQHDIALQFAGDSAAAKKEIDKQYEKEKKEIRKRELKAEKEMALFNIAIDTAQGIVSALASTPPNVPLSIAIGAIGAIQLGIVASKKIPQYWKGTENHKGGLMMVNDGSGSNYRETIVTPDGNIIQPEDRNVIMDAKAGTKVFTHDQWKKQLDSMLFTNKINYAPTNGLSREDLNAHGRNIVEAIQNKTEYQFVADKSGFNTYIREGHTTKEIMNNRIDGIGKIV